MQIPKIQNLVSQTFKSNLIEFVWLFPKEDGNTEEFSFRLDNKGNVEVIDSIVSPDDEIIGDSEERFYEEVKLLLEDKNPLPVYKNFLNGQELIELAEEAKEFWIE